MNPSQTIVRPVRVRRGIVFGAIIITALMAFEVFNYSTTDYALADLLGGLTFLGLKWSTILAIAFCGIDFAGIARLFTPDDNQPKPNGFHNENWYLFGAWLLAATMNAMLTWWGVSLAVLGHQTLGNEVVSRAALIRVVPIFVAILVWLIRVLIIGTFSMAGDKLFDQDAPRIAVGYRPLGQPGMQPRQAVAAPPARQQPVRPLPAHARPAHTVAEPRAAYRTTGANSTRAAAQAAGQDEPSAAVEEPTYHSITPAVNHNKPRPGAPGGANRPQFRPNSSKFPH